jgi:outer membrane protein
VGIAGMNYDAELKQFKEGLRTMTEVLEMLTRLGDSQMKEIRAITDYQIALIDLSFATGTLLGYTNVSFAPSDLVPAQ